ncbi:hypothetical protein AVEN_49125-1 [Araneus ventricosus]|uniref:Uncharacterized protein n=1 Tax=Araneus ventricosus TaxID=182803 RepID=A0A4Y2BZG5_ARAVE|nr:hypothetical protein AVEN_49125-1 [Araneus ventricosus]
MDESNYEVCHRHSECGGRTDNWNVHTRHPNYISGYTGNIPTNLRWTGDHRPCETRDFLIPCRTPVNTLYVVHPEQYLPDGTLELPKIKSQIPPPLNHAIARHTNHPHIKNGSVACHHENPWHTVTFHRTYDPKVSPWTTSYERAFGHKLPCGCGSTFMDYRLVPPPCMNVGLKHGKQL